MLRLLSLLQSHRFWAGTELSEKLGVSQRTLRRDIDRLRGLGYLVDASPGVAGGYQLRSGSTMPPLLLDDDEAVAIAVGLTSTANSALTGMEDTSVRALAKVVQVMPPRLRRRVDALQTYVIPPTAGGYGAVNPGVLVVLAQAARDSERVRFDYAARNRSANAGDGSGAGTVVQRHAEPHWLVPYGRRWYLIGYDLDRNDWRTYRLDRLSDPSTTGARFRPRDLPDDLDPPGFVHRSLGSAPREYHVRARIEAPAEAVERVVGGWGEVESLGEGVSRLTMNVDEFHWPMLMLVAIEAEFTVEQPAEFTAWLDRVGRSLLLDRRSDRR